MKTNRTLVSIALMISTFLTAIEGTVVSTAMPKIVSDLQGIELMNWVFSIYLLTSAVLVPVFGKLTDLFGRKLIFTIGTVIFLVGSIMCGFSQSMEQLIFYRALQGIGAAAINPVTMTIIGDIYPPEKQARMIGLIGTVWSVSGIIGPLVGGFFVDQFTWHWIFFMNIPFGIISLVMIALYLKENLEKSKKTIDYLGAVTFSVAMVAFLYALQKAGSENNWLSPEVLVLFILAAVFMTLFVWVESRVKEPMLPLSLFRVKIITVANGISFLVFGVLIGLAVYIPMWVQGVLGKGAMASGFMLTPSSITWTVGSFICGRLMARKSPRWIAALGLLCLLTSTVWLSFMNQFSSPLQFYFITGIQGIGFGLVSTLCTVNVQSAVDWSMRGVAAASNIFFRSLGQTVGVALLGTFFNAKIIATLNEMGKDQTDMDQLNLLINANKIGELSPESVTILRGVLVEGIHFIFLILVGIVGLSLLLHFLLHNQKPQFAGESGEA